MWHYQTHCIYNIVSFALLLLVYNAQNPRHILCATQVRYQNNINFEELKSWRQV